MAWHSRLSKREIDGNLRPLQGLGGGWMGVLLHADCFISFFLQG